MTERLPTLQFGHTLQGRYRIIKKLASGGMGTVYVADDNRLTGRRCAIKEMSPAELAPQDRNWSINAFRREAEILAQLHHAGLTAVTDFFAEQGNWYLVMDFVEGETLAARLEHAPEGRFPIKEALRVARQLLDVLEYLHNREPQVVFRDLKPGNVMCTPEGEIKLIDFGIARFFKPGKTQDTTFLGTPGYAAPEQYGGMGQSDPRTDIYSLGVVLNQMVTGYDPTTAVSPFPIPEPRSLMSSMPAHIADVISRATQMRPELRYGSVAEMRADLFPRTYPLQGESATPSGETAQRSTSRTGPIAAVTGPLSRKVVVGAVAGIGSLGLCVGAALFIAFRPAIFPTSTPTASPTRPIASTATEEVATVESPEVTEPSSDTPVTGLNPKDTPTEPPTAEPTEPSFTVDSFSLGESSQGRALAGTRIGYEGDTHVVVVGSIQGDQTMTRALVRDLISYLERTPERVPEGTMYHLIPTINPDGNASNSRYNARGVDLNRNWDTGDWERDAAVPGYPDGKPGAGGSAPFSEQETRSLREYLQMLNTSSTALRVIVLHSSVRRSEGEVYPGGSSSLSHAEAYAEATGYDIEYAWAEYVTSGEAVTWCEEQGIPSLDIVIPAAHDSQTRISSGLTLLEATVNALARVVQ